jgi:hypothetical protein
MALKLLQSSGSPLGQFDCLDADLANIKGGEAMTFGTATISSDAGDDSPDGYVYPGTSKTVVKLMNGTTANGGPIMLSDDGTTGYGTLFGTVVGGTIGQVVTGGAVLGPHTATGSGKITCWDKPGLYGVTTDAVDSTAVTGFAPTTNTTLVPGAKVYVNSTGKLTPYLTAGDASVVAGRFVSFETDKSLVTTPNRLVSATNSPTGEVALTTTYTLVVLSFNPTT